MNTLSPKSILVLGSTGMLGHTLCNLLSKELNMRVIKTTRNIDSCDNETCFFFDAYKPYEITKILAEVKPDVVINCIGVIKQLPIANNPVDCISINSILPHVIATECASLNIRFIQISTDCVFSGSKGRYNENDLPDATDLYGRSKQLGEVYDGSALTIRTSIIGHELNGKYGLLEWFLSQQNSAKGYAKAYFSGLTTVELSRLLINSIIPDDSIKGLYHIASAPISKYDLLCLIKKQYKLPIEIVFDSSVCVDRTLDASKFKAKTNLEPRPWEEQIQEMHSEFTQGK